MRDLTIDETEFLRRPLTAQLATLNPTGSPHLTVMWFLSEGGDLLFSTTLDRAKSRNVAHDARATALILDPADDFHWIRLDGDLIVDPQDPVALYHRVAGHYLTAEGLEWWSTHMKMGDRTVLRLKPRAVLSRGFGGSGVTVPHEFLRSLAPGQ